MEIASGTTEGTWPKPQRKKRQRERERAINQTKTSAGADWASLDSSIDGEQQNGDVLEITDIPIPQPKAVNRQREARDSWVVSGTPSRPSPSGVSASGTSGLLPGNTPNVPTNASFPKMATLGSNSPVLPMQVLVLQADECKNLKGAPIPPHQTETSPKKTLLKSRRVVQRGSWVAGADQIEPEVKDTEVNEMQVTSTSDKNSALGRRRSSSRPKRQRNCQVQDEAIEEEPEDKKVKNDSVSVEEEKPKDETLKENKPNRKRQRVVVTDIGLGDLVWGKLQGFDWWPARVVTHYEAGQDPPPHGSVWLRWFGDDSYSQVCLFGDRICSFGHFKEKVNFIKMKQSQYRRSLLAAVEEAAQRAGKDFRNEGNPDTELNNDVVNSGSSTTNKESTAKQSNSEGSSTKQSPKKKFDLSKIQPALSNINKLLLCWAITGFLPTGPDGFKPSQDDANESAYPPTQTKSITSTPSSIAPRGSKSSVPSGARSAGSHSMPRASSATSSPPTNKSADARKQLVNKSPKANMSEVWSGSRKLEDVCLSCGSLQLLAVHPLFFGGLCAFCKASFVENYYLFDEDGTQMYCTICSDGIEVYLCDSQGCSGAYCTTCIERLCGKEELDRVRDADSWICYLCHPETCSGLLKRRPDWQQQLHIVFQDGNQMQFDPFPPCKPIPLSERKPIRVLGLFDGIATGLLVLKELGFEIEKYIASEIDYEAVKVTRVHHSDIVHVGDIRKMTETWIKEHGPFDLIMGGSPCNDLSVANPFRKGVYDGTGKLFFEFYRLLSYARPCPHEDPRPFFFLYENVVSMRAGDKDTISRFLQCNPLVLDAKDISPANRARYFWGNLPGMNRPAVPLPSDRLSLQDCLESNCNRIAQVHKIRTVTTKANSIKQTTKMLYPVEHENEVTHQWIGDILWCTELERAFGFPDHYTDVGNMGRVNRQRLLGRSWSVPVIRHLFSPLKDYFKCHVESSASSS